MEALNLAPHTLAPHRQRLGAILAFCRDAKQQAISLNMATFWTTPWDIGEGRGCLLGHYVNARNPLNSGNFLRLEPITFRSQIKSQLLLEPLLREFPTKGWTHYTLHYRNSEVEGHGLTAVCLYFQIRPWDAQNLFWPAGVNYQVSPNLDVMALRIERFIRSEPAFQQ